MVRVSFQGERGAYSEEAVINFFGNEVDFLPLPYLSDVFRSVESSSSDYAVVPIENSLEGSVSETYDLLLNSSVKIVGESILRVRHCFMIHPEAELSGIKEVWSHPQALSQCRKFIEKMKLKPVPFYDTAGSAKAISEKGILTAGAIASCRAASFYNLKVVEKGIEDSENNFTRFIVIGTKEVKKGQNNKTSLIFGTPHSPGSLYRALKVFADSGINLTKIESRPTKAKPWEYYFFVDFVGNVDDQKVKDALEELKKVTTFIKLLGSYPAELV
ncbi:MAG: prephenate dehydratase [Nitrososphaeria archaeon]|nr:prephenate dehydratase [Conexivisphaerales archaeon]